MPILSRRTSIKALLRDRKTIAVIAPHPDDEVFGCGILIAAACRSGVRVVIIVLTDGHASHPRSVRWPTKRLGRLRRSETRHGLGRMGASDVPIRFLGWDDGALMAQGCQRRLRRTLIGLGVKTVLVTSPLDFHTDHRAAFALAARATAGSDIILATYQVWSRVDVRAARAYNADTWRKKWAVRAHRSQLGNYIADDPTAFVFDDHALRALVHTEERYMLVTPHQSSIKPFRKSHGDTRLMQYSTRQRTSLSTVTINQASSTQLCPSFCHNPS